MGVGTGQNGAKMTGSSRALLTLPFFSLGHLCFFFFWFPPLAGGMNAAKTTQMRAIPAGRLVLFLNPGSLAWGFFWCRSPFLAPVRLGKVNSNLYTRALSILVYLNDECRCTECHSQERKSATHSVDMSLVLSLKLASCSTIFSFCSHQMDLAHVVPAKLSAREVEA